MLRMSQIPILLDDLPVVIVDPAGAVETMMPSLLIAGGEADSNLRAVINGAARRGVPYCTLLTGKNSHPTWGWDLKSDHLLVDGCLLRPSAIFIRYDVFDQLATGDPNAATRAFSWYTAVIGWAKAHPEVRIFNAKGLSHVANKSFNLMLAAASGLAIPDTVVTNDIAWLSAQDADASVVKPVADGGFCQATRDVLMSCETIANAAPQPAFVQERLVPPEVRIYRIGRHWFGFRVESDRLDYRTDRTVGLQPIDLAPHADLIQGLDILTKHLGLDFGAADFKTCPQTGRLLFLEFNNAPMFAAFDRVCNGLVVDAILETLCKDPEIPSRTLAEREPGAKSKN